MRGLDPDTSPEHLTRPPGQKTTGLRPSALPLRGASRPVLSCPGCLIVRTGEAGPTGPRTADPSPEPPRSPERAVAGSGPRHQPRAFDPAPGAENDRTAAFGLAPAGRYAACPFLPRLPDRQDRRGRADRTKDRRPVARAAEIAGEGRCGGLDPDTSPEHLTRPPGQKTTGLRPAALPLRGATRPVLFCPGCLIVRTGEPSPETFLLPLRFVGLFWFPEYARFFGGPTDLSMRRRAALSVTVSKR